MHRRLSVADIQDDAVCEPALGALARSVRVVVDEKRGNSRGATVRITSRRHGVLEKHVEHIPGGSELPITPAEFDTKLRECAQSGIVPLGEARLNALAARVKAVHEFADMAEFFAGIVA